MSRITRNGSLGVAGVIVVTASIAASIPASADTAGASAIDLARAVVTDQSALIGAQYVNGPPDPSAVATGTTPAAGFPSQGLDYAILSTGVALAGLQQDQAIQEDTRWGAVDGRAGILDATTWRIDFTVPATANCLLGVDFRFLTEEYPEYVGSAFNDEFIVEADQTTWTSTGAGVSAPDNIAFDTSGNPISVNAGGAATMTAGDADGTVYDGATPMLSAATPLAPGPHSLFFTIFDEADDQYDSAIFVDNLRVGAVADPATQCVPGAVAAVAPTSPVAPTIASLPTPDALPLTSSAKLAETGVADGLASALLGAALTLFGLSAALIGRRRRDAHTESQQEGA